jgi:hypothetical protein
VAEHCDVDDCLLVDQFVEGAAHARIVERLHLAVPDDALPPSGLNLVDMGHGTFGELFDLLRRQVENRIDRAAFERCDGSGEFRNDADDHAIEGRHAGEEIVGVAFHHQLVAGPVFDKAERPRADRMGRQRIDQAFADDRRLVGGDGGGQVGIGE